MLHEVVHKLLIFYFRFRLKINSKNSVVYVRKNDYDYKWPVIVKVLEVTKKLLFQWVQST